MIKEMLLTRLKRTAPPYKSAVPALILYVAYVCIIISLRVLGK
jgi:hypothetical protein